MGYGSEAGKQLLRHLYSSHLLQSKGTWGGLYCLIPNTLSNGSIVKIYKLLIKITMFSTTQVLKIMKHFISFKKHLRTLRVSDNRAGYYS